MVNPEQYRALYEREIFSEYLPYHDYSVEDRIYSLSDGGCGIIFRCFPQHGVNEVTSGLTSMYSILPEDAHVQIIMWANPNVTDIIADWKAQKAVNSGLYSEIITDMENFFPIKAI
jgi:hypothetical protein